MTLWSLFMLPLILDKGVSATSDLVTRDGDVHIAVLAELHHSSGGCSALNLDAFASVLAADWAVRSINEASNPHEPSIGLRVLDTCGGIAATHVHLNHLLTELQDRRLKVSKKNEDSTPILGVLSVNAMDSMLESSVSAALAPFSIPLVVTSAAEESDVAERRRRSKHIVSTATTLATQAQAIVELASSLSLSSLSLLASSPASIDALLSHAALNALDVSNVLTTFDTNELDLFLVEAANHDEVVAILLDVSSFLNLAELLSNNKRISDNGLRFILGVPGLHREDNENWRKVFRGAIVVTPKMAELKNMNENIANSLQDASNPLHSLMSSSGLSEQGCSSSSCVSPRSSYVVRGVSALSAAFRLVQLDACVNDVNADCLALFRHDVYDKMLEKLEHIGHTSKTVHNRDNLDVLVVEGNLLRQIGRVEGQNQLELLDIPVNFLPEPTEPWSTKSKTTTKTWPRQWSSSPLSSSSVRMSRASFLLRSWTLVVLSVTIFGLFVSTYMLLYILHRLCTSHLIMNSQILPLLLLLGVIGLFISVLPWLVPPESVVCSVRILLHPLLMVVCFAVLLVKAMQIKAVLTLGFGGSIPQLNQILSLIFMIAIQVLLSVHYYSNHSEQRMRINEGYPECDTEPHVFLLLHIYPASLLLLAFLYSVPNNNRAEGRAITSATLFVLPVFVAWPMVYVFAPIQFHDPSMAVSIVSVAGILLLTILVPKIQSLRGREKHSLLNLSHSDHTEYTGLASDHSSAYRVFARPAMGPAMPMYGHFRADLPRYHNDKRHVATYNDWARLHSRLDHRLHRDQGQRARREHRRQRPPGGRGERLGREFRVAEHYRPWPMSFQQSSFLRNRTNDSNESASDSNNYEHNYSNWSQLRPGKNSESSDEDHYHELALSERSSNLVLSAASLFKKQQREEQQIREYENESNSSSEDKELWMKDVSKDEVRVNGYHVSEVFLAYD